MLILSNHNTHKQIDNYLRDSNIQNLGTPTKNVGNRIIWGDSKKDKLYNSFANEFNNSRKLNKIFNYIERVLNPAQYTKSQNEFKKIKNDINEILLFMGYKVGDDGLIFEEDRAKTLSEVNNRINEFKGKLRERNVHSEIFKYCKDDINNNDYGSTILEATKSIMEKLKEISNLNGDGCALTQKIFSKNEPYIYCNKQETDSDWNEHNGLRELIDSMYHIVRNPLSHTPKINWKTDEEYALDILTIISFIHKYLEICGNPRKYNY